MLKILVNPQVIQPELIKSIKKLKKKREFDFLP